MNGNHSKPSIPSKTAVPPGATAMVNLAKMASASPPSIRPKPITNVPIGTALTTLRPITVGRYRKINQAGLVHVNALPKGRALTVY